MKLSLALVAGLFVFASCGGSAGPAPTIESNAGATTETLELVTNTTLFQRIASAPSTTAYSGIRSVKFWTYASNGSSTHLDYIEQTLSNGSGDYLIEPRDVLKPQMSLDELEVFMLGQQVRAPFFRNHRDFQIRDVALFRSNYSVYSSQQESVVVGRPCMHLEVHPNENDTAFYALDVDIATGLILASSEYDARGRMISRIEFLELTVGALPEVEQARLQGPLENWREPTESENLTELPLGAPRILPEGYRWLETRVVRDDLGAEWYEMIYGDGVEELFVLFALNEGPGSVLAGHDEISLYRHGSWLVAEGLLKDQRVIALGKLNRDELMIALESCL